MSNLNLIDALTKIDDQRRREHMANLGCDRKTGVRYAIAFDASGEPYRAFTIDDWSERTSDGKYRLAQ